MDLYEPHPIAQISGVSTVANCRRIAGFLKPLDNVFAASLDGFSPFHLNGPKTPGHAVPVDKSGSGSGGVTVSPSLAFFLQCRAGISLSLRPSGSFNRQFRLITGIGREHRPEYSCVPRRGKAVEISRIRRL